MFNPLRMVGSIIDAEDCKVIAVGIIAVLVVGLLLIMLAGAVAKSITSKGKLSPKRAARYHDATERVEARKAYERLVKEKLEVIKTAITMGYDENELERLDARLEGLIGKDKLQEIVAGDVPLADSDLLDSDLDREIARERKKKTVK